ncbi:MAG: DUF1800 family protein [Ignavibacteria bacterium]|nr:DUF1800 family protein [Ignavibacteria bacterium]
MLKAFVPSIDHPYDYASASHLLRRATIAPTHEEILQSVEEGLSKTLDNLFVSFDLGDEYIDEWSGKYSPTYPQNEVDYVNWFWTNKRHVEMFYQWWLMNIRDTPVSLQERLVLFWHGHFATDVKMNIEVAQHLYVQYRLLQKMCMGNFKAFIKEITQNMAMELFLSLHYSYVHEGKKYINENYAREMMELHTVGIFDENNNRNYTQKDVYEAARGLTGWFSKPSELGEEYLPKFSRFIPERWDDSEKTYLGQTGKWNTDDIIRILFEERAEQIAVYICKKLYSEFIGDEPDKNIVHELASTFKSNNWELKPVLRELLGSEAFFHEDSRGVLKKSRIDYIIGMVRQCDLQDVPDFHKEQVRPGDITMRLEFWGQLMYNPPNVSGWKGKRDWVNPSVLSRRLQFAREVVQNKVFTISYPTPPSIYRFDVLKFANRFENINNPALLAIEFANYLLPHTLTTDEVLQFQEAILDGGKVYEWDINDPKQRVEERIVKCLLSIVSHPAFQLY